MVLGPYTEGNVRRVLRFIPCLNYMMFPLVLYPPPLLRQCIAIFAVAEGWLLLDIGLFVLFLQSSNVCHFEYTAVADSKKFWLINRLLLRRSAIAV